MSRGVLYFLIIFVAVILVGYFWAIPAMKRRFLGESLQVKVNFLMAVDETSVAYNDTTVARTVVVMDVFFPMGSEPDSPNELEVRDDGGHVLDVYWDRPEIQTDEDKRLTRWRFKYAFFPYGFRKGVLRDKARDLYYLKLPPVPYNPPLE